MGAKLTGRTDDVSISDMKDGDVGEITQWPNCCSKPGDIIQRYRETIIVIGESGGSAYTTILNNPQPKARCRILSKGDTITLT